MNIGWEYQFHLLRKDPSGTRDVVWEKPPGGYMKIYVDVASKAKR